MRKILFSFVVFIFSAWIINSHKHDEKNFVDNRQNSKNNKNVKIITHGSGGSIEKMKDSTYLEFTSTISNISSGDSITIVPKNKRINSFNIEVNGVSRRSRCGKGDEDGGYLINPITIDNDEITKNSGKYNGSFFKHIAINPTVDNVKIVDSSGKNVPVKEHNGDIQFAIDISGDGRTDLFEQKKCCRVKAHPDSIPCRECTGRYHIQNDTASLSYQTGPC